MSRTERVFWAGFCLSAVLGLGCCGGGSAGTSSAVDVAKHLDAGEAPPDASRSGDDRDAAVGAEDAAAGDAAVTPRTYVKACERACAAQSDCLRIPMSECKTDCESTARDMSASCAPAATAEQDCLAGLTCKQMKAYVTQGRRDDPRCGEQAQAYFKDCTPYHGRIPSQCTKLCKRYPACGIEQETASACEEDCTLQASDYRSSGSACSDAYLAFVGCGAKADCDEIQALESSNASPAACDEQLDALNAACD
jgi:hypothetical protein